MSRLDDAASSMHSIPAITRDSPGARSSHVLSKNLRGSSKKLGSFARSASCLIGTGGPPWSIESAIRPRAYWSVVGLLTLRWREPDSNLRSRCDECRVRDCRSGRRSFRAPGGLFARTHVPDVGGRKRQLVGHRPERGQSIGDGVGHQAADRDDRALAGALDAERVTR